MIIAEIKRVQVYCWESPKGVVRFLIPRAMEIIAARPQPQAALPFGLADAAQAIRSNPHATTLDLAYAMKTDLNKPLIIATTPDGFVIIDGWHRIIKQVLTHTNNLPVDLLTAEETLRCIVDENGVILCEQSTIALLKS
jgi:hypothetical protein